MSVLFYASQTNVVGGNTALPYQYVYRCKPETYGLLDLSQSGVNNRCCKTNLTRTGIRRGLGEEPAAASRDPSAT